MKGNGSRSATGGSRRAPTVATVEIDRDALQRLEAARQEGESLSQVIKRCVPPRQTAEAILRTLRQAKISDAALEHMEQSANQRRQRAHQSKE
jgi:predicted CopG family antitoxin